MQSTGWTKTSFAPGARILVRDAEWLIRRVDNTSTGGQALRVVDISEFVRDKESIFLTEIDDKIAVLDPAKTKLVQDQSSGYRSSLLYLESLLRQTPPTDERIYLGNRTAMDAVPYQLDPANDIKGLFIRRFKNQIQSQVATAFKKRKIATADCRASSLEEATFDTLTDIRFTLLDQNKGAGELFKTTLEKSLFSSPMAFLQTIGNRIRQLEKQNHPDLQVDIKALQELEQAVKRITPDHFSKYQCLIRVIRNELQWTGHDTSIPLDYKVKSTWMGHANTSLINQLPMILGKCFVQTQLHLRSLSLTCLTTHYADLWSECWNSTFQQDHWAKTDPRVENAFFTRLSPKWHRNCALRTDYTRRQALVEIDVLVAMALGLTLEELQTIYRVQFPVIRQYEADTWYDAQGRIIFTNSKGLSGVGLSRAEWEKVKGMTTGTVKQTITDDTLPSGPHQRTITYHAPFDKCDREKDYETGCGEFSERGYGDGI